MHKMQFHYRGNLSDLPIRTGNPCGCPSCNYPTIITTAQYPRKSKGSAGDEIGEGVAKNR